MKATLRLGATVLVVVGLATAGRAQSATPTPAFTPGVARPLSQETVCTTRWGQDARHVTEAMKKQVFAAYGIPWDHHALYEVDHLISRELGGADDVQNLWPEPWYLNVDGKEMGARQKDRAENATHKAVCAGTKNTGRTGPGVSVQKSTRNKRRSACSVLVMGTWMKSPGSRPFGVPAEYLPLHKYLAADMRTL